jgi:hypothetical protein
MTNKDFPQNKLKEEMENYEIKKMEQKINSSRGRLFIIF